MVICSLWRYVHELTMPLKTTLCTLLWYNWHISKQIRAMTYLCFGLFLVWWIIPWIHKYHSIEQRLNQFIRFVLLASSLPNCRPPSPGLGGFCASWKKLWYNQLKKELVNMNIHLYQCRVDQFQVHIKS